MSTSAHRSKHAHSLNNGIMLLGLLILLALSGIALMSAVDVWSIQAKREREADLMFAGSQIRQAIRSYYYAAPPGTPKSLPPSLDSLLEDPRYPTPVRHLRRLYPDPVTGKAEWGEVRLGERLAGVYSLSENQPIKQAGFPAAYETFAGRSQYRDWVFAFTGAARDGAFTPPPANSKPPDNFSFSTSITPGSKK